MPPELLLLLFLPTPRKGSSKSQGHHYDAIWFFSVQSLFSLIQVSTTLLPNSWFWAILSLQSLDLQFSVLLVSLVLTWKQTKSFLLLTCYLLRFTLFSLIRQLSFSPFITWLLSSFRMVTTHCLVFLWYLCQDVYPSSSPSQIVGA